MKRALIIFAITTIICAHFMPYLNIKADTVNLSTLQDKIADVDTMVSSEQELFKQSLGLATALSMRQTGYSAPETNAIEELGDWVWSKIHDIGDGTRDVAQWVVDRFSNIIDGMKPDHSSGSHRFTYTPTDAPLYNSLYTDDEWNSLVSSWASANSHDDNFISFDDVTDDVEGWADKLYDSYVAYYYPNGTTTDNPPYYVYVNGMSVQLRTQFLQQTPGTFNLTSANYPVPNGNSSKFINSFTTLDTQIDYVLWKPNSNNTYFECVFVKKDGTMLKQVSVPIGSNSWTYNYVNYNATPTEPKKRIYQWNSQTLSSSSVFTAPNYSLSFPFNETTAAQYTYNWYHATNSRQFNIRCYWSPNSDGSDKRPYSVHPGAHPEWTAPTYTPIYIDNTRTYMSVTNNTTVNNYNVVYNYVTNNILTNENVINNVFNQTVVNYILPNPTYIEGPEATPEPIGPTPTPTDEPTPTPTDEPTSTPTDVPIPTGDPLDPSLTPTPINVQPIIPWPTGLPITPPPESSVPVPGSEVNPTPSDIPSLNIDIPSLASLTTDGQIQNSVLVNDEGKDVDNDDIVQDLFNVIPGENDPINLQLIIFGLLFVGIVVTYLTK